MDDSRKAINKILLSYFELIDSFFGAIKHYLGEEADSHIDLGLNIASYPLISDLILDAIGDLSAEIEQFWSKNAKTVFNFIKKQDCLKCLYSGDITPVVLEDFVKRSVLYIDTIILPDPLFNLTLFQKQIILDKKYYLNKLVRHVFNVWKLKDLVLVDTKEKAVLILPVNLYLVNNDDRKQLLANADERFTTYVNEIFHRKLEGRDSCLDFLSQQKRTKDIFEKVKHSELLPNKFKVSEALDKFLVDFSSTGKYTKFGNKSAGWNFGLYLHTQFIRVQEHKFFCNKLIAEPIYDYELPWFFFNYEVGGLDMDASIANALQRERFDWITKAPISALKILREENKLDYMRSILRKGVTDLKAKNDNDLLEVSKQLEMNFKEAFQKQKAEVGTLEKEVAKITKKDMPIVAASSLVGLIPHPWVNVPISIVSAGRDIYNLLKEREKAERETHKKENNFINLLMKSYDKKQN